MKLVVLKNARKEILKLVDKPIQERVLKKIDRIQNLENPKSQGDSLTGNFAGLWRYGVRNYKIICKIKDDILEILVVKVIHRKEVY